MNRKNNLNYQKYCLMTSRKCFYIVMVHINIKRWENASWEREEIFDSTVSVWFKETAKSDRKVANLKSDWEKKIFDVYEICSYYFCFSRVNRIITNRQIVNGAFNFLSRIHQCFEALGNFSLWRILTMSHSMYSYRQDVCSDCRKQFLKLL